MNLNLNESESLSDSDVPAADHKRVQGNGFCPQHGGTMASMHKVYC